MQGVKDVGLEGADTHSIGTYFFLLILLLLYREGP